MTRISAKYSKLSTNSAGHRTTGLSAENTAPQTRSAPEGMLKADGDGNQIIDKRYVVPLP
jgi:hypothetical protein